VSYYDIGVDALALIEFADRDDGENLTALLDRSNLRELAHALTAVALTWGTELAERQGYGSLAEKIAYLRMAPDICPVCGHGEEAPADGCACGCHVSLRPQGLYDRLSGTARHR
jgi:hypothetical protein